MSKVDSPMARNVGDVIFNRFAFALLTFFMLMGCVPNYSEGERDGVVIKLSRKGLIWKSWEGEAVMGGTKRNAGSTTTNIANVFEFNVSVECVDKVQSAMESGQPVRLIYRQWLLSPLSIENSHVVVDVK